VEWAEGVEPSPSAWRADVLSVDTTPTHGRPGGTLTPVSRSAAARLDPRPPGDALPEEDSNPHSRSNNPTSCRLDDLASVRSEPSLGAPASCRVDGRGRTCTLRFRRPVPCPFGHVDVRALGLEPSLVRGKSPVPLPVRRDARGGAGGDRPLRCLCSCQGAGGPAGGRARRSRLGRSRTPGRRCWRPRRHRGPSPWGLIAHDVVRVVRRNAGDRRGVLRLTSARLGGPH
jgi:hypothetical protein